MLDHIGARLAEISDEKTTKGKNPAKRRKWTRARDAAVAMAQWPKPREKNKWVMVCVHRARYCVSNRWSASILSTVNNDRQWLAKRKSLAHKLMATHSQPFKYDNA